MSEWKLFYDGGCNLCHVSKLRAEKWAQKAGQPMHVDVLVSDEALAKGYGEDMVLEADGAVYKRADAWMKIMTIAPWYFRWVSWFSHTKATMAVARFFYELIAKYRYKLFGTRACQLPTRTS